MSDVKSRTWAFLVYPESVPENWIEQLKNSHMPMAISPVHNLDVCNDGTLKKPHYHVVIYFDGPARSSQALKILEPLGINHVEAIAHTRSYNRYLAHLDDPDKAQYDPSEIVAINGAVVDLSKPLSPEEQKAVRGEVLEWCRTYNITEYAALVDYASLEKLEWLDYVETHTIFLNGYIRSRRCTAGIGNGSE